MPAPPTPLDPKLPLVLPPLIPEPQEHAPPPGRARHDPRHRHPLLQVPRHRLPVRPPPPRPPGLQVHGLEPRAQGGEAAQLGRDEGARRRGAHGRVEEGVDVGGREGEDGAEGGGVLGEDAEGLGGRDGPRVAGCVEGGAGGGDEGREGRGGGLLVEDGFVADYDQFDQIPFAAAFAVAVAVAVAGPVC